MNANRDGSSLFAGLVIVVEDEPGVRLLLEEMLAEVGFSPVAFEDAATALAFLEVQKEQCVLIIADEGLPGGMRGSELIERAHQSWPSIPTILMSGYSIGENTIPEGAIFLNKPYSMDQLEETLARALQSRHLRP